MNLALVTHPWGLRDPYLWPPWRRNRETLLPARHLAPLLMVWEFSCPREKRDSQTFTDLLAFKLFHGKTWFFLSARRGLIPVFSPGWDQKWDRGVPSSTAQQSAGTCQLHTPSGCQESRALTPGFDLLQNIVSSEERTGKAAKEQSV